MTRRLSSWAPACVHFYVCFWPGDFRWGRAGIDMRAERSRDGGGCSHLDASALLNLVVATLKRGELILS